MPKKIITVPLDDAFIQKVKGPIYSSFQRIAPDLGELEGKVTHKGAIEMAIDANHLEEFGFKEAEDLVTTACTEHGYPKVLKFLATHIKL